MAINILPPPEHQHSDIFSSLLLLCRDYPSIVNYGIKQIPKLTTDWTDFSITDPGILWLSAIGYIFDIQNYRLDKKYYDNVLRYASNLNPLLSMCSYLGIDKGSNIAPIATIRVEVTRLMDTFFIPRGFRFKVYDQSSGKTVVLNTVQESHISLGTNLVLCIEGEIHDTTLVPDDFSKYNQYLFDRDDIAYNSFMIMGNNSKRLWEYDEDVLMTFNEDPCYSVSRGKNRTTKLTLCPGFRKLMADMGDEYLIISYTTTKGAENNLAKSAAIDFHDDPISYSNDPNAIYALSVDYSENGRTIFDIDELKHEISSNNTKTDTLMLSEDFEELANGIDGIYNVSAFPRLDVVEVRYVKSTDISDEQATTRIEEAIDRNNLMFSSLLIKPIEYIDVEVDLVLYLIRNTQDTEGLKKEISDYLEERFSFENQKPGTYFNRVQIASDISELNPVIDYCYMQYPNIDIDTHWNQIIRYKGVSLTFYKRSDYSGRS